MRPLLLALFLPAILLAQEPAAKPDEKPGSTAPAASPAAESSTPPAEAAAPAAEATAPAGEPPVAYSITFGYRGIPSRSGNFQTYRSIVDLGEGPKLFGLDFTYNRPHRWADRVELQMNDWGGEPNTTGRLYIRKLKLYDFSAIYRNISYYNFLPSFADPTIAQGVLLNQRAYDTRYRTSDVDLTMRPGSRIVPYVSWNHSGREGSGITVFEAESNEYPVGTEYQDKGDYVRGGVRIELNRFHFTVEQGGSFMKDDQRVFSDQRNTGNRTTPLSGQQLFLTSALQAYGVRGSGPFSKALLTASPFSWLDVYGSFQFSQPHNDVNYTENATGNLVQLSSLLFFTREQAILNSQAKAPHTSGNAGFELRPLRRVRILESWFTDRLHVASNGILNSTLFPATGTNQLETTNPTDRYSLDYSQQEVNVFVDVTRRLTIRAGHRYVWGTLESRAPSVSASNNIFRETGKLERNVGLAGVSYKPSQKISLNADLEAAAGNQNYFRTSLQDYKRGVARVRYQAMQSLSLGVNYFILDNQNPTPTVNYDFRQQAGSLSVLWAPSGGKKFSVLGEYTRSLLRSDITYIVPQTRDRERSFYRDDSHSGTGALDLPLWFIPGGAKLSLGGSYFFSSGSRPTQYHQPFARLQVPVHKNVQFWSEWRWYGYAEPFYGYENFRANLIMGGIRISRGM